MNIEAKKKYCGLLMFDVPSVSSQSSTSRNDFISSDMSTREVDSAGSAAFYESRNGQMMGQMFIQENFGAEHSSQPRSNALAAGAAAGDERSSNSTDPSNSNDSSTADKSQPPKRTPRPPNAFILYRQARQPAIIAESRHLTNAQVSRRISDMWKNEAEETRLFWERVADRKKLEHMQAYPDYVYRPNKSKSKVDKRRERQKKAAAAKDERSRSSAAASLSSRNESTSVTGAARKKSRVRQVMPDPLHVNFINPQGLCGFANINASSDHSASSRLQSQIPTMISNSELQMLPSNENLNELLQQQQFTSMSPLTPSTPPQLMLCSPEFKLQYQHQLNSIARVVPSQEEEVLINGYSHHHPSNHHNLSFDTINRFTGFHQNGSPVDMIPDVMLAQQHMCSEIMLHSQLEASSPTTNNSSASNSPILNQSASQQFFQPTYQTETNAPISGQGYYNGLLRANFDEVALTSFINTPISHHNTGGLGAAAEYLQ